MSASTPDLIVTSTPDLIVTWPKSRPLASYLEECRKAELAAQVINYRLPSFPALLDGRAPIEGIRVYLVYDGLLVGWQALLTMEWRDAGEVRDPVSGGSWPAGVYVVRDPQFHAVRQSVPMRGFQGYRYLSERPD